MDKINAIVVHKKIFGRANTVRDELVPRLGIQAQPEGEMEEMLILSMLSSFSNSIELLYCDDVSISYTESTDRRGPAGDSEL